jgi:hypothetical protein
MNKEIKLREAIRKRRKLRQIRVYSPFSEITI